MANQVKRMVAAVGMASMVLVSGCSTLVSHDPQHGYRLTKAGQGATVGAAGGAVVGGLTGGTQGALIGAGVGGVAGGVIGHNLT